MPYVTLSQVIEGGKDYIRERVKDGVHPMDALREYMDMILTIAVSGDISLFKRVKEELEEWILRGMKDG